jgi:hypothetical protein
MTMNVGTIDRIIRALAGLAILSLVFLLDGTARWWGLLGLFPLTTAAIGYCLPYAWLGINTCGRKNEITSR